MGNIWVLIPLLGMSIPIFAIWTKHLQKVAEIQARTAPADHANYDAANASKMQALEDRVRVLERIVTDGGFNVAAQIEALRDAPQGSGVPLTNNKETV